MDPPDRIVGVDFSGARDARENVWIAECERRDGTLRLTGLAPARERLDPSGRDPAATAAALAGFLRGRSGAAGLDVPFSLPAPVARGLGAETWRELLEVVAGFDDASAFDTACQRATPGDRTYARRATDAAHGSFSPYHFFVKRQTYTGMSDVLRPLVVDGDARVLPMDIDVARDGDRLLLLEMYPAAVLDGLDLHREEYKGTGSRERERRGANLAGLRSRVSVPDRFADRALADTDGDALDAIAAAVGTERAFETDLTPATREPRLEGAIYPLVNDQSAGGPHDT